MMHETSDLSFDELVDAACEELDLELNRPPPPPPPPTRREKLARWCRRILQDRLKPPIQRTARLATTVLNAELPVDVDAVSGAALSLTARVAHAGFRTLRWTLLAPLAPIAFARNRLRARRDEALPLHAPARPAEARQAAPGAVQYEFQAAAGGASPVRKKMVPAPVALTPDAEAPARPPASPSFASPRPAASPQFTSPEAYLHGNYEAPRPQIAPRQLFDEDAEVDLPPARDAAPARVTPDERFATSRGVGAPSVAADPRAGTTYPGQFHNNPQHASLRAAATADERFATSRGVASQPPKTVVVGTPPSSPVRPNGAAALARSPSAVEGYALY